MSCVQRRQDEDHKSRVGLTLTKLQHSGKHTERKTEHNQPRRCQEKEEKKKKKKEKKKNVIHV